MTVGDQYYGEVTFTARDGYYGRKSSGSAVFYQFAGYEIRYDGALIVPLGKSIHRIGISSADIVDCVSGRKGVEIPNIVAEANEAAEIE